MTTLVDQVVISGQVRDALSGETPRTPVRVVLIDRDLGAPHPLDVRVLDDASFAFHADPLTAFPQLADRVYRLRVEASAPGYLTRGIDFDVGQTATQPERVQIPIASQDPAEVALFTGGGLPTEVGVTLSRVAVSLRGRVVSSAKPDVGVAGASLQVSGGPTATTDAFGRFAFAAPLPLALAVDIALSATGFHPTTKTYEPSYREPVDTVVFALAPT